jgi:uncharacterized protein (DUF58 family)
MVYGNGHLNKYEYACTLACSLAYLVLKQQDAVGCVAFDEKIRTAVPMRTKNNHIFSVVDSLAVQEPRDKTDMFAVLRTVAETAPRRGVVVLVSDLLADRPGLFKGLRLLRQRGHDVLVFHVMDDDELDFPFSGPTRFEGLEMPDFLNCNPRALREGYLAALQTFLDEVRRECARSACDYALVRTGDPLDAALATFLSKRLAVMNRY